jgi:transglutaminase-like putative cysteine protease/predicted glutamine amidotransferase
MSQLLALSFDCPSSPSLSIEADPLKIQDESLQGWGLAWYPSDDYAATIIKDSKNQHRAHVAKTLKSWKRFNSTLFLFHLRGAAKRAAQQDTQPFTRSFAGRDWLMSHNGDLDKSYKKELDLGKHPIFEPMGLTDSEHMFCWLLNHLFKKRVRTLRDVDTHEIYSLLQKINNLGTCNMLLTDSQNLIVYNDKNNFHPIYWARKHPPYAERIFTSASTHIEIDEIESKFRTFFIISTYKNFVSHAKMMVPGQMFIVRRGNIIWNSDPEKSCIDNISDQPLISYVKKPAPKEKKTLHNTRIIHAITKSIPEYLSDTEHNILSVKHHTCYQYKKPVYLSKHAFRLQPIDDFYQKIINYQLMVSTMNTAENFQDVFGNEVSIVKIDHPFSKLHVSMTATVICYDFSITQFSTLTKRRTIPLLWLPWQRQMMLPYLLPPELPESQLAELTDYAMSFVMRNNYDVLTVLSDINNTLYQDFTYASGSTTLETTPFEVYLHHKGVCQDFANLFICLTRLLSIPSRYRTGYIYTGGKYGNKQQSDASHAWVEVYIPWLGWRGYDPTNGCLAGKNHIRVACGRNYYDATPTSGTLFKGGGTEKLIVNVKVKQKR